MVINWGIIGFGNMGKQFLDCFNHYNSKINLVGIASKSEFSNKELTNKYIHFKSYDDLINFDKIDAVYISTLNNSHKNLVLQAEKKNKKILCEKPAGLNFEEVKQIYENFKNKKNQFFEAIAYRSHPQIDLLKKTLSDKEIGDISKITSSFGFKVKKRNKESRLFNKNFGGGSILDLGCYPVSFFNLFKKKKGKIQILNKEKELCETNVDIDGSISLKIDDKILAYGRVSLKENLPNICLIDCDKARIIISDPWMPTEKSFIEVETKSRYYKIFNKNKLSAFTHQLNVVSENFSNNHMNEYLVNIEESLDISKIINSWLLE
jgi:predicted dehydrogenase